MKCAFRKLSAGLIGQSRLMACTLTMRNNCLSRFKLINERTRRRYEWRRGGGAVLSFPTDYKARMLFNWTVARELRKKNEISEPRF